MLPVFDEGGEQEYLAGQEAPPGHYVRMDALPYREITLKSRSLLPPSHDGHVAVYRRVERDWLADLALSQDEDDSMITGEAQQA